MPNSSITIEKTTLSAINTTPNEVIKILKESRTIAIIGMSNKPGRASLEVGLYLKGHGYHIIPVNPRLKEWENEKAYPSLTEIPNCIDIINIFRKPTAIDELADEIIEKKPKHVWFQLGIVNNSAAKRFRKAGITVTQNRCIMIEHRLMTKP